MKAYQERSRTILHPKGDCPMRMRVIAILLITVAITAVGIATGVPKNGAMADQPTETTRATKIPLNTPKQQPTGSVDGSTNPELIPDQVAYSLLFRVLSNRHTKEEQDRARAYLRMAFECSDCSGQTETRERDSLRESRINAFLAVVREYERRVSVLDRRAREIHALNWRPNPSPEVLAELNELQERKDAIMAELVASLPRRLGTKGKERLQQHINERVKSKVKIHPSHVHN